MIARQLARFEPIAAVLTPEFVAGVDILTGEFDVSLAKRDKAHEAYDRGHAQREFGGPHLLFGFLDHLNLLEENEFDRSLPVDNVERFERCVQ